MELKEILTVVGRNDLFKFVSSARGNAIIVESLTKKGERSILSASAKVSSLEDIAIFTNNGEVAFGDVLKSAFEFQKGEPAPDFKAASDAELKEWFANVLPDYDKDRVYVSHIRKIVLWYNLLLANGMISFEEEKKEEE